MLLNSNHRLLVLMANSYAICLFVGLCLGNCTDSSQIVYARFYRDKQSKYNSSYQSSWPRGYVGAQLKLQDLSFRSFQDVQSKFILPERWPIQGVFYTQNSTDIQHTVDKQLFVLVLVWQLEEKSPVC